MRLPNCLQQVLVVWPHASAIWLFSPCLVMFCNYIYATIFWNVITKTEIWGKSPRNWAPRQFESGTCCGKHVAKDILEQMAKLTCWEVVFKKGQCGISNKTKIVFLQLFRMM